MMQLRLLFFDIHHRSDKKRDIVFTIDQQIYKRSVKIYFLGLKNYCCSLVVCFHNCSGTGFCALSPTEIKVL